MDRDTRLAAMHWLEQRTPAVVVEIVQARGSAPRGAGTRMLVSAVQAVGSIGGGHLEYKALATARAMLAARDAGPRREHYPLGPALGQCCGGAFSAVAKPSQPPRGARSGRHRRRRRRRCIEPAAPICPRLAAPP